ncbi:hypothetical protein P3X46_004206 [Hevea brasiliensis]|uniref:Carbonic anhydrase n=1 Tax=Hevea brasiliensis TaxID=3981 RepID=A0ABQ9MW28_HEVBR|nr:alpha carbonic anhydrase 1, chloroplastic [Hevea brasiliensis]KAJ9184486.1 hypothetical protein P3X46_004206 [Hevea brasiliensis]
MAPRISFSILALALFLAVASAGIAAAPPKELSGPFTYYGPKGASKWGSLSPEYSACSKGKIQSPININRNETVHNKNLKPLIREYKPANATLVTNVCNIGLYYEGDCGRLIMDDKNYTLKKMHWHSPSEHWIDGIRFPLELHLVHAAENNATSVVAVLYQYGRADPFIAKLKNSLDKLANEVKVGDQNPHIPLGIVDSKLVGKKTRKYYRYMGSLTTPPCTENVVWHILGKTRTVTEKQVQTLKAPLGIAYKVNERPLQALNGRKVELFKEFQLPKPART